MIRRSNDGRKMEFPAAADLWCRFVLPATHRRRRPGPGRITACAQPMHSPPGALRNGCHQKPKRRWNTPSSWNGQQKPRYLSVTGWMCLSKSPLLKSRASFCTWMISRAKMVSRCVVCMILLSDSVRKLKRRNHEKLYFANYFFNINRGSVC